MLLLMQVMILPPIVYEQAINVEKRGRVIHRLGTIMFSQVLICIIFLPCLVLLTKIFNLEVQLSSLTFLLGLILQLNDYSGTIDPHVAFNIGNDDSLSFLGWSSYAKNSFLIFVLANIMPDTRSSSQVAGVQISFGLYQFVIPLLCTFLVFIPTALILKEGKYQNLSNNISSNFDISITLVIPIFAFLICETLKGSGLQAVLICGLLQGVYGLKNITQEKRRVVLSTVRYVSFLMRQIASLIIGILVPFFIRYKSPLPFSQLLIMTLAIFLLQILTSFIVLKMFNTINGQHRIINRAEMQVSILQSFCSCGVINFVFAFGTKNDSVITIVASHFIINTLIFMPLAGMWINKSTTISEQAEGVESQEESNHDEELNILTNTNRSFSYLKQSIQDFHLHKITPWLVKCAQDDLGGITDNSSSTLDKQGDSDDSDLEDNPIFDNRV